VLELPAPDAINDLDATELLAVQAQLMALQAAVVARLVVRVSPPEPPPVGGDGLLTAKQAAELLGRSESWLRKRGSRQPGFIQLTGRGGQVRYSKAALLEWLTCAQPW
jgi:hypothetical protein